MMIRRIWTIVSHLDWHFEHTLQIPRGRKAVRIHAPKAAKHLLLSLEMVKIYVLCYGILFPYVPIFPERIYDKRILYTYFLVLNVYPN